MKPKHTKRSQVLLTLGILFSLAGAARFLPNNLAIADETQPVEHPVNELSGSASSSSAFDESVSGAKQVCFTKDTAAMLSEDRRQFEEEKQGQMEERLSLQAWREELNDDTVQLQALQQTLETRWQRMQEVSDGDIQHLAEMYRAMKPDQAASIFDQMDPAFAAGFLRLMPSDQAGLILARMQTGKAYVVSVKLASINSDIRSANNSENEGL